MGKQDLVDIDISHDDPDDIIEADSSGVSDFSFHRQTVVANRVLAGQPDTELRSLSHVDEEQVKLLEHQVDTAYRALFEMDGKALLADEVGLGKTIEVGMILKEMHYRETDDSVLILTPAQLAKQWQAEMQGKFGLEFVFNYDTELTGFDAHAHIIACFCL